MNDDEFFDAAPVAPDERGESFGLCAVCYRRMARCALRAMEYGRVEPVLIRRLLGGGCELLLYGNIDAYTLRVHSGSTPARIALYFLPLDSSLSGPGCELFTGYDEPEDWHRICGLMIWREGTAGSEELLEWQEISDELAERNGWEATLARSPSARSPFAGVQGRAWTKSSSKPSCAPCKATARNSNKDSFRTAKRISAKARASSSECAHSRAEHGTRPLTPASFSRKTRRFETSTSSLTKARLQLRPGEAATKGSRLFCLRLLSFGEIAQR